MTATQLSTDDKRIYGLRKLYASNTSAKYILDYFASGDFPKQQTDEVGITVDRIISKLGIDRSEVVSVLRIFETMKFGEFLAGRRGFPSRFLQKIELSSLGNVAKENAEVLQSIMSTNIHTDDKPVVIQIVLPSNISDQNVSKLLGLVRSMGKN